jgi:hypothetical protein
MSPAPETITAVGLVYEAASLVFGPAVAVLPDRVVARVYREGDWQPLQQGRDI